MKTKAIETFLPIFSGFYSTIWEFNDENLIYNINSDRKEKGLNPINWDSLKIDYRGYELDIVKSAVDSIGQALKDFVYSIEFQKVNNPKEYNFANDSVDVAICPKLKAIKTFIYEHKEDFQKFLTARYTSYDGFISSYANDFETWEAETKKFSDLGIDGHRLGAILEFIAKMEGINEMDIYEDVMGNMSEDGYVENYEAVNENPSCTQCENVIGDVDILTAITKYKSIQGVNPKTCLCENCLAKVEAVQ